MKTVHVVVLLLGLASSTGSQSPAERDVAAPAAGALDARVPFYELPDLRALARGGMRDVIERHATDRRTLQRFYDVSSSPTRRAREAELSRAWLGGLAALDFEALDADGRIDYLLFRSALAYRLRRLELDAEEQAEIAPLLPFAAEVWRLQEERRSLAPLDPAQAAATLVRLQELVEEVQDELRAESEEEGDAVDRRAILANRAAGEAGRLRATLEGWFAYHDGYDPLFSWWVRAPYEALDGALEDYASFLREDVAGIEEDDADTILGDPIGDEALRAELAREWIPYTPGELLAIADAELAWCDRQMARAAEELGFGDDWRAAQEHVKTLHVGPGEQPALIRELAFEAVDFLEERELLTIPALARNCWRMEMMSPERQRYTPYFTGGEVISVSFPTEDMEHDEKLMSMRGNNRHFSRATVHHELIPGHHLQQFMNARHRPYRRAFATPFWGEGWALYWEMLLWDEGFPRSPEDRVGMLFWRKHRCARILFSLRFQLGEWTPQECIEFLVERVGHERRNATAEVRRSVQGGYGPLYQAAYMLGGLQFRALHAERVGSGAVTNRAHHDAILRENSIPVELLRAKLTGQELGADFTTRWRFYDALEAR